MASNPPGNCCAVGVKHEGEAKGSYKMFGDTEVYVTYPPSGETHTAILYVTDIIGHRLINAQLVADQLAEAGYFVAMPDIFHGDAVPLIPFSDPTSGYDLGAWLTHHQPPTVIPTVEKVVKALKAEYGVRRLGAVGYCFGAKYAVQQLGSGGVQAAFIAHPSFVTEDEVAAVKGPLSIAAAETDEIFPAEKRYRSEEILKEIGVTYQISLYSGVEHGFAVRADTTKKDARFAKEAAFYQAVAWFDAWLKE